MAAFRYSGDVRGRLTYLDTKACYRVFLTRPNGAESRQFVGEPVVLQCAVDSPEAFDEAFRAAISFADHEADGDRFGEGCSHDANGAIVVARKAET